MTTIRKTAAARETQVFVEAIAELRNRLARAETVTLTGQVPAARDGRYLTFTIPDDKSIDPASIALYIDGIREAPDAADAQGPLVICTEIPRPTSADWPAATIIADFRLLDRPGRIGDTQDVQDWIWPPEV